MNGKRRITVYRGSAKDYEPVPRISFQEQRLEGLGFSIGDRLADAQERILYLARPVREISRLHRNESWRYEPEKAM